MLSRDDMLRRHRNGVRCVSVIELSLTLSVIAGLLFVSLRVMSMHPATHGQTAAAIAMPVTGSSDLIP